MPAYLIAVYDIGFSHFRALFENFSATHMRMNIEKLHHFIRLSDLSLVSVLFLFYQSLYELFNSIKIIYNLSCLGLYIT